jgi:phytoene dehydrogenase-like protein
MAAIRQSLVQCPDQDDAVGAGVVDRQENVVQSEEKGLANMPRKTVYDAVVVGSGPNGLAAAITLARAGRSVLVLEAKSTVGGGMRSAALTLPGFVHDVCSSIHPLGLASPFFKSLALSSFGVEWIHSPVAVAHPLDDGTAVLLERSLDAIADSLEADRSRYLRHFRPLVAGWDDLVADVLGPFRIPQHPFLFARFGMQAGRSIHHFIANGFRTPRARAFLTGLSAHSIMPTRNPGGAAYGLLLGAAGHAVGWPVARGGSHRIAEAMEQCFVASGGEVQTETPVRSLDELPRSRSVLLDVTPHQLVKIAGSRLPTRYRRSLSDFRYGPGVFKLDWALDGPIPWKAAGCGSAATVHLGGTSEEIAAAEDGIWQGQHAEKPFVILGQQSLFDRSLVPAGKQSAWAYCHVPNGSTVDMTDRIEAQVERFAPGFRRLIIGRHTMNTHDMETYNPNYIGGDIAGGRQQPFAILFRPLGRWQPYTTPARGLYLCSASMPPGAGVHGMCGYYAARRVIRDGL